MIDLTCAFWITIAAMVLMSVLWISFILYETENEKKVKMEHTYDDANHCVMCDATIPEGRHVCPECENDIKERKRWMK